MPIYPPSEVPRFEAMTGLARSDPLRVMLACSLASLQISDDLSRLSAGESAGPCEAKKEVPMVGVLAAAFECCQDNQFPTLKMWVDQQKAQSATKGGNRGV